MSVVAEPAVRAARGEVLERADGVELIGEYEGSGFRRPPLLARRGDGQVVQLTWLLYLVAGACDGRRDAQEVADAVSERYGRRVSTRNVLHVAQEQLRPTGVLALADGTTPELPTRRALLALRHRRPFASARVVGVAAGALTWLHRPLVQLPVLLTLALFDVWLFGIHGIAAALLSVVYEPGLLLFVLGLVVAATLLHELGHASACRYGGARPGVMGIGLYLVWPAFYCDVTDAYRLNRAGRLRTDLGGVYFNGIFALLAGGAYFVTGVEALLLAAFLQHTIVLQQLLPLLRFDGYYVLSDLTGVPDILSRIKPIFRSLIPGRREPKVDELKPWVRVVVTAYLLVLAPMLVLLVAWIVVGAPRLLATTYDSLGVQLDRLRDAAGPAELGVGALRIAALLMPVAGTGLSVARSGKMATRGLVGWARGSVARSIVAVGLMGAAALFACSAWWPDRDYRPIQPGERGTIGEAVTSLPKVAEGVPPLAAAVPTSAEPDTMTPEIGRRQGSRRHSWTGRHASGRTSPEPAVGDGVPDARLKPPESAWDDGDLYPTQDHEPSSDVGDVSPPASSATPTPAPATDQTTTEPAATPTPTPTETGTPTPTPTPTETATPTPTPTETATPTPTETPVGTADPSPTASAQAEVPDATPSPTPTP